MLERIRTAWQRLFRRADAAQADHDSGGRRSNVAEADHDLGGVPKGLEYLDTSER